MNRNGKYLVVRLPIYLACREEVTCTRNTLLSNDLAAAGLALGSGRLSGL
jgi:hypothetical protein